MPFNCSAACVLSTVSIIASGLYAQATPIQSNVVSDTVIYITQDVFSDHPIVTDDQLATNNNLSAAAIASMSNIHGVFSGSTVTSLDYTSSDAGSFTTSMNFQGNEAAGAPLVGGYGHGLVSVYEYEFTLDGDGSVEFDGSMTNSETVFEASAIVRVGSFSAGGSFNGYFFNQQILDTDNLGTVPFVASTPLTQASGHYLLEIRLTNSGIGLRSQPAVSSSLIANFIINAPNSCPADLTGDGVLDFFDVSAFLTAFGIQDPIADFNNDGSFDFFDVSAFLTAFGTGCP